MDTYPYPYPYPGLCPKPAHTYPLTRLSIAGCKPSLKVIVQVKALYASQCVAQWYVVLQVPIDQLLDLIQCVLAVVVYVVVHMAVAVEYYTHTILKCQFWISIIFQFPIMLT